MSVVKVSTMNERTFLTCIYYYSLPEFPESCAIVKNNSLFVRDILVCNPINQHVIYGGQYDPHYEHDFAPQFKMCWKETRRKIMPIKNENLYNEIYLLFRTTKVLLSKASIQCISGYYDIDIDKVDIDPDYEEPVLYAKEAKFVNSKSAISLADFLAKYPNHRFPFSSETRNGIFKKHLMSWAKKIEKSQNHLDDYIEITRQVDKIFKYNEYEDGMYYLCEDCEDVDKCYLTKRINKKGKLYHQLPEDIASRINDFYKKAIKIA